MAIAIEEVTAAITPTPPEPRDPVVAASAMQLDTEAVMRLIRREQGRIERKLAN